MNAFETDIESIISGDKQYYIPVFQRNYLWGRNNWEVLWSDVKPLIDFPSDNLNHFIGPFVFISHASPSNITSHLIIDGQQRLITISLILCAIRDLAKEYKLKDLAESIDRRLYFKDTSGKSYSKIIPRILDRDTLINIIFEKTTDIDDTSQIYKAYSFFAEAINSYIIEYVGNSVASSDKRIFEILDKIFQAVVKNLQLVEINLDKDDNPTNIYASLNFEGIKLSDADLIRNFFFMQIGLNRHDEFNNKVWLSFEDLFIIDGQLIIKMLEDFYYRYLICMVGYFPRNQLYHEITKYVSEYIRKGGHTSIYTGIKELIIELKRYANYFIKIKKCEFQDEEINNSIGRFNALSVDTAIPLLLNLYNRYDLRKKINKATLLDFILMTESFIIRRSFLRLRTRGYGLDFSDAIKNSDSIENLEKFYLDKGWPKNEEVVEALQSYNIYTQDRKKAYLVLSEIERSYKHKEKVILDELTIEHVLPQSQIKVWMQMLGENAEEVHEKLVNTLGNLTLTGYNPELSTKSLKDKKKILKESNLEINKYFQELGKWGEEEIIQRSEFLANKACEIWRRPIS